MSLLEFNPLKRTSAEDALCFPFFETNLDPMLYKRNPSDDDVNQIIGIKVDNPENNEKSQKMDCIDSNDQNKSPPNISLDNMSMNENFIHEKIGLETSLFKEQTPATSDKTQSLFVNHKVTNQDSLYLDISPSLLTSKVNTLNSEFDSLNNSKLNMIFSPTKSKFPAESPVNIIRVQAKSINDENIILNEPLFKNIEDNQNVIKFDVLPDKNSISNFIINSHKLETDDIDNQENNIQPEGFSELVKQNEEFMENQQTNHVNMVKNFEKTITFDVPKLQNSDTLIFQQ